MKRAELIAAFRQMVDDETARYLWSDAELRRYLDAAQREAAERGRLLRDTTTAAVTQVAIVAGIAGYALDGRILDVERAKLRSQRLTLEITSTARMDRERPGWQAQSGAARYLLVDAEGGGWRGTLAPIPTQADMLDLAVHRLPMGAMNTDDDAPEIPERYHLDLLEWMAHLAYKKRDTETYNELKSLEHGAAFTAVFGERIDANVQRKQAERRPETVHFREF